MIGLLLCRLGNHRTHYYGNPRTPTPTRCLRCRKELP